MNLPDQFRRQSFAAAGGGIGVVGNELLHGLVQIFEVIRAPLRTGDDVVEVKFGEVRLFKIPFPRDFIGDEVGCVDKIPMGLPHGLKDGGKQDENAEQKPVSLEHFFDSF